MKLPINPILKLSSKLDSVLNFSLPRDKDGNIIHKPGISKNVLAGTPHMEDPLGREAYDAATTSINPKYSDGTSRLVGKKGFKRILITREEHLERFARMRAGKRKPQGPPKPQPGHWHPDAEQTPRRKRIAKLIDALNTKSAPKATEAEEAIHRQRMSQIVPSDQIRPGDLRNTPAMREVVKKHLVATNQDWKLHKEKPMEPYVDRTRMAVAQDARINHSLDKELKRRVTGSALGKPKHSKGDWNALLQEARGNFDRKQAEMTSQRQSEAGALHEEFRKKTHQALVQSDPGYKAAVEAKARGAGRLLEDIEVSHEAGAQNWMKATFGSAPEHKNADYSAHSALIREDINPARRRHASLMSPACREHKHLQRQIIKDGSIFSGIKGVGNTIPEVRTDLKKFPIAKGLGIGAALVGGGLLARKLLKKKEEPQLMSARGRIIQFGGKGKAIGKAVRRASKYALKQEAQAAPQAAIVKGWKSNPHIDSVMVNAGTGKSRPRRQELTPEQQYAKDKRTLADHKDLMRRVETEAAGGADAASGIGHGRTDVSSVGGMDYSDGGIFSPGAIKHASRQHVDPSKPNSLHPMAKTHQEHAEHLQQTLNTRDAQIKALHTHIANAKNPAYQRNLDEELQRNAAEAFKQINAAQAGERAAHAGATARVKKAVNRIMTTRKSTMDRQAAAHGEEMQGVRRIGRRNTAIGVGGGFILGASVTGNDSHQPKRKELSAKGRPIQFGIEGNVRKPLLSRIAKQIKKKLLPVRQAIRRAAINSPFSRSVIGGASRGAVIGATPLLATGAATALGHPGALLIPAFNAMVGAPIGAVAGAAVGAVKGMYNKIPAVKRWRLDKTMERIQARPTVRMSARGDILRFGVTPLQNVRNKVRGEDDSTLAHDIKVGTITGGIVGPFTGMAYDKIRGLKHSPLFGDAAKGAGIRTGKGWGKFGALVAGGAVLGGLENAVVGTGESWVHQKRKDREPVFSAKQRLIQFGIIRRMDLFGTTSRRIARSQAAEAAHLRGLAAGYQKEERARKSKDLPAFGVTYPGASHSVPLSEYARGNARLALVKGKANREIAKNNLVRDSVIGSGALASGSYIIGKKKDQQLSSQQKLIELAITKAPKPIVKRIADKLNSLTKESPGTWTDNAKNGWRQRPRVVLKDGEPHLLLYRGTKTGGKKSMLRGPEDSQWGGNLPSGTPGNPSGGFAPVTAGELSTSTNRKTALAFARYNGRSRQQAIGTYMLPESKIEGIHHINPYGESEVRHHDMGQHLVRVRSAVEKPTGKINRAIGAIRNAIGLSSRSRLIHFDTIAPGTRTRVATDRYVKQIHERDMDRAESGYLRTGAGGAAIGALTAKRLGTTKGRAALIGGLAGLGAQAIVRHSTKETKDQFGDRSFAGKRADRAPSQIAGIAALGLAGKAAHDKLQSAKIAAAGAAKKAKFGTLAALGIWGASKLFSAKGAKGLIQFNDTQLSKAEKKRRDGEKGSSRSRAIDTIGAGIIGAGLGGAAGHSIGSIDGGHIKKVRKWIDSDPFKGFRPGDDLGAPDDGVASTSTMRSNDHDHAGNEWKHDPNKKEPIKSGGEFKTGRLNREELRARAALQKRFASAKRARTGGRIGAATGAALLAAPMLFRKPYPKGGGRETEGKKTGAKIGASIGGIIGIGASRMNPAVIGPAFIGGLLIGGKLGSSIGGAIGSRVKRPEGKNTVTAMSAHSRLIHFKRADENPEDEAQQADDRDLRKAKSQFTKASQGVKRGHRLLKDIVSAAKGQKNLDSRGRERKREWDKPWVRGLISTGIGVGSLAVFHKTMRGTGPGTGFQKMKKLYEDKRIGQYADKMIPGLAPVRKAVNSFRGNAANEVGSAGSGALDKLAAHIEKHTTAPAVNPSELATHAAKTSKIMDEIAAHASRPRTADGIASHAATSDQLASRLAAHLKDAPIAGFNKSQAVDAKKHAQSVHGILGGNNPDIMRTKLSAKIREIQFRHRDELESDLEDYAEKTGKTIKPYHRRDLLRAHQALDPRAVQRERSALPFYKKKDFERTVIIPAVAGGSFIGGGLAAQLYAKRDRSEVPKTSPTPGGGAPHGVAPAAVGNITPFPGAVKAAKRAVRRLSAIEINPILRLSSLLSSALQ